MPTGREILDLPMQQNDAGADTIEEYLATLLLAVWDQKEGFSGKRPFGNSGWELDLHIPLVKAGFIDGSLDGDDYLARSDDAAAHRLIRLAIFEMTGWEEAAEEEPDDSNEDSEDED